MKTKILIILIILIGLSIGGFFIWKNFLFTEKLLIEGSEHWIDRKIILDGSLIIQGSLTLENVILKINSKTDGEFKIDVEAGGELRIINSTTTAVNPQFGYQFYYRKGSKGYIKNSVIEYTSAGEDVLKTGGHGGMGGLNVFTDGFVLRDSIIRNSKGRGVLIGRARDTLISGNIFADNGYDGLRVYDSSGIIVENNTGYGNAEYAIKAMYSKDVKILNNIARNNKDDGIHINTCENVLIEGNEIFDNGKDGLQVGPGREEGGSTKIFAKNNKVRRNEENGILFLTTSESEISGNIVEENGENGILIQWECENVTVSKNTVKDNGRTGMVVLESSNVIFSDNEIDEIYHDQTSSIEYK